MQFESKNENGILVLKLSEKRLDAKLAIDFRDTVGEFIKNNNKLIILNMSAVDFIDSSGLGAIVSCLKLMGPHGHLSLCGLSARVVALFKLTRMDKVFTLCATEEQALQSLSL